MIRIDGARGEGGGQILRTALGLSLVTGQPFRIQNIRAGRRDPGLLRQHLTAVRAAAAVGRAEVSGDELGSATLEFTPRAVVAGHHTFTVGTAGSATLVLQTVLPALLTAKEPSRLVLEGGTHNTHAPPFDFLARTFLPLVNRMGPRVTVTLERYGFYPAGGGRFIAEIAPVSRLMPLQLIDRGEITHRRAVALVANLKRHIAVREVQTVGEHMNWKPELLHAHAVADSPGPGNIVLIEIGTDCVTEVFTAFGRMGVLAETVALEAVRSAREWLASGAAAGEYLADQLLIPLALAGSGEFTASTLSLHATTNADTIRNFLPVQIQSTAEDRHVRVVVSPAAV